MDAILLSLTLQKRTMYKIFFWLLSHLSNIFAQHIKNLETYFAMLICFEFWPLWRCMKVVVINEWSSLIFLPPLSYCLRAVCIALLQLSKNLTFDENIKLINLPDNFDDIEGSQGSKFKTNQYRKIRLQIFDTWCKNVKQMC